MRIALIADTFPPLRSSGAVQLRDLSKEFARQGHTVTVLLPSSKQKHPWSVEQHDGVEILRLKTLPTKNIGYIRRTIAELLMPFTMLWQYKKSPLANEKWDGVVWYSPSIFLGPIAKTLKKSSNCKGYLIVRDIFPEWAMDMNLIGRIPFYFFKMVAKYQYSVADVIGIQTPGNKHYFDLWLKKSGRRLEILQNWLGKPGQDKCSIRVDKTCLAGRKIFVYAGNMGIAQGIEILLNLASRLQNQQDIGFLFVGRGTELNKIKVTSRDMKLENIIFFDEINADQIPDLYSQCSVGIVSLDHKHKSHNIPGKFITYMQNGLPILACINKGNDLAKIIRDNRLGKVCESHQIDELSLMTQDLLRQLQVDNELSDRCKNFFKSEFSVERAVKQIISALTI